MFHTHLFGPRLSLVLLLVLKTSLTRQQVKLVRVLERTILIASYKISTVTFTKLVLSFVAKILRDDCAPYKLGFTTYKDCVTLQRLRHSTSCAISSPGHSISWSLYLLSSDGSSPKKSIPGQSRALNIDREPGPSLGPSQKFDPEP